MADVRTMHDSPWIHSWDLAGRAVTVRITEVVAGTLIGEGGRKTRKPILRFEKTDRRLALNKTNTRTIVSLYGNDTAAWIGKLITIYPTKTTFGRDEVDAVRVKATIPAKSQPVEGVAAQPVDEEAREAQQRAAAQAESEAQS